MKNVRQTLVAAGMLLIAMVFSLGIAAAQVSPDEAALYAAFHAASQANDDAGALGAAKAYLDKFPTGQYADAVKQWQTRARLTRLDEAIKAKRTEDMITAGKEILAADPGNLNVVYALAFNIRRNELLASPAVYTHSEAAAAYAKEGIALVEGGKTLTGVASFDKNATLAWMTQILAIHEGHSGSADEAIKLYEKSTALAPADSIVGRNLYAIYSLRHADYVDAAKAYNALPEADRGAAEPSAEAKAAREAVNREADALIDSAAAFVAYGRSKGLPAATVDRVNQTLESVYKGRFPEDAALDGLKKILAENGAPAA